MIDDLLQRTDRVSMANSLEIRNPYLDHELIEFLDSYPLSFKVKHNKGVTNTKIALREYARKRIPKEIIRQPKKGFSVPTSDWLNYQNGEVVKELLLSPESRLSKLISTRFVETLLTDFRFNSIHHSRIWNLVFLETWLRVYEHE